MLFLLFYIHLYFSLFLFFILLYCILFLFLYSILILLFISTIFVCLYVFYFILYMVAVSYKCRELRKISSKSVFLLFRSANPLVWINQIEILSRRRQIWGFLGGYEMTRMRESPWVTQDSGKSRFLWKVLAGWELMPSRTSGAHSKNCDRDWTRFSKGISLAAFSLFLGLGLRRILENWGW